MFGVEPGDAKEVLLESLGIVGVGLGLSIHGFSFGMLGVVYCDSAVRDKSHFFGA